VPRLKPFPFRDRRHDTIGYFLSPALHIPDQGFFGRNRRFRLQHHGAAKRITGIKKRARHTVVGIAIDAVGSDRFHNAGNGMPVAFSVGTGAIVPGFGRQEYTHTTAMKIGNRSAQAVKAPRQIMREIGLIAIIDTDVRIDVPDQHAIDATKARFQIIEVAINGVLACRRIVKETIFDHHLRMHEITLCPSQFRAAVVDVVIADACQVFAPPVFKFLNPVIRAIANMGLPVTDLGERPYRVTAGRR